MRGAVEYLISNPGIFKLRAPGETSYGWEDEPLSYPGLYKTCLFAQKWLDDSHDEVNLLAVGIGLIDKYVLTKYLTRGELELEMVYNWDEYWDIV